MTTITVLAPNIAPVDATREITGANSVDRAAIPLGRVILIVILTKETDVWSPPEYHELQLTAI